MYLESDDELIISVGQVIQYESSDGEMQEGEVMEIIEEFDIVKVLPTSKLLKVPEWISAENIILDDNIELVI